MLPPPTQPRVDYKCDPVHLPSFVVPVSQSIAPFLFFAFENLKSLAPVPGLLHTRHTMTSYMPPDALFLAPPHSHDPCDVSHVAALPQSMLQQLPESVQTALWTLQESTSIIYASYVRLEDLISERFDRLIPLPFSPGSAMMKCESMHGSPPEEGPANSDQDSEGAYFNYVNHCAAEQRYLVEDAFPDWRHKASRAGLKNYHGLRVTFAGKEMTIAEWFAQLQTAVTFWSQQARAITLPDFDTTVLELQSQITSPSSDISEEDTQDMMSLPMRTARHPVDSEGFRLEITAALEAL